MSARDRIEKAREAAGRVRSASGGQAEIVREILAQIKTITVPMEEEWELSIGWLLNQYRDIPALASKGLGMLDRFGALRLSPTQLGIENHDIDWSKISAIHTRQLSEVITTSALEREAERFKAFLPPLIPGRGWLVERVTSVVGEVAKSALDRSEREGLRRRVVSEVEYRGGFGRSKTIEPGIAVISFLGSIAGLNDAVLEMATRHHTATLVDH